ncbi:MAG: hypothetical protein IPP13_25085 [Kouleothrix sp.]|jgi:hypothetical protein|nr:hypothetical protein [Kouleothrix sp.]
MPQRYNPKWREYKGRRHYGDYDEYQAWKPTVDFEIRMEQQRRQQEWEWERKYGKKDWTLPDKSNFYGTFDEFQQAKQEMYARWNREKEQRDRVIAQSKQAKDYFYSEIKKYHVPPWSSERPNVNAAVDSFKADCERAWANQDASGLYQQALHWVYIISDASDRHKIAEERKRNEREARKQSEYSNPK